MCTWEELGRAEGVPSGEGGNRSVVVSSKEEREIEPRTRTRYRNKTKNQNQNQNQT
jgi:hypothetical protein